MILVIDNYDSFVFNLARYVSELGFQRVVKRNDEITLQEIENIYPEKIIISPGPCTPKEAGISMAVIQHFGPDIPILGVCLGHQAIGEVYGGTVTRARFPLHGKASAILHDENALFKDLKNPLTAARYHSLIVSEINLPPELKVTARSKEGEIMALQHREFPVFGVQFHPESILTEGGYALMKNFLLW
jgi:anthranilate synthase/aminodeoxychorismate synthase-like glutamine amidotransferase